MVPKDAWRGASCTVNEGDSFSSTGMGPNEVRNTLYAAIYEEYSVHMKVKPNRVEAVIIISSTYMVYMVVPCPFWPHTEYFMCNHFLL